MARPRGRSPRPRPGRRSEEHTSELQSRGHLVCRLLLEKKQHFSEPILLVKQSEQAPTSHAQRLSLSTTAGCALLFGGPPPHAVLFFSGPGVPPELASFPTRRSSD